MVVLNDFVPGPVAAVLGMELAEPFDHPAVVREVVLGRPEHRWSAGGRGPADGVALQSSAHARRFGMGWRRPAA